MKRTHVILCLAMALTLAIAGTAQSAMWVGAQLGANFAANTDVDVNVGGVSGSFKSAAVEPSVIGGLTIGYDFVREGFLGANYPDWMKYFSFATDFTYNRFDMRQQNLTTTVEGFTIPFKVNMPRAEGSMAVWSFLFIGKYGFFPDSEVPFGRLVPYIGVGPGIVFSSLNVGSARTFGVPIGLEQSASSVDIALVVETGIRFMALKNVSLDAAFRYRWCQPTYSYTLGGANVDVGVDANQFSALVRASYHF